MRSRSRRLNAEHAKHAEISFHRQNSACSACSALIVALPSESESGRDLNPPHRPYAGHLSEGRRVDDRVDGGELQRVEDVVRLNLDREPARRAEIDVPR